MLLVMLAAYYYPFFPPRNVDQQLLGAIIELLHLLWFTTLGQKEKRADEAAASSTSTEGKAQGSGKCLPLQYINEFLSAGAAISKQLRYSFNPHVLVMIHC